MPRSRRTCAGRGTPEAACRFPSAGHRNGWGGPGDNCTPERVVRADERAPAGFRRPGKRTAGPGSPAVRVRARERAYFFGCSAISFSISSMMPFISRIAALNGAEVVMSTPASLSSSIGYFDEPEESIAR